MYQETRQYADIHSVNKFCVEWLDRCECCDNIEYSTNLSVVKLWHGKVQNVCDKCKSAILRENEEMSGCIYDEIDAIVEAYRLGIMK